MAQPAQLGFLGLGIMGYRMAGHLLKAGHDVALWSHTASKAQQLAKEAYHEPKQQVPDWLLKISYDQWRGIRFRPEKALWHDRRLPVQIQFFHPGLYYNRIVAMNVVDAKGVQSRQHTAAGF